jgi:hypothetical protein
MTRVRDIANILGVTEAANPTNAVLLWEAAGGGGVTVYATKEDLPSSGLTSGDQAYVTANSRFYISNGSGWYNVALVNATPTLTISPSGTIQLSKEGASTVITLTGADSDNAIAGLTYSVESDGNFAGLGTISQDSSVFTITPLSEDSATTSSATLTFKVSDDISFGAGTTVLNLSFEIPNSQYTTFLLQTDASQSDAQIDASTNALTLTQYNDVTSNAFTPYHPGGYATYFGSATAGITTDLSPATGDWTIEGWVCHTANTGTGSQNRIFGAATNDPLLNNTGLNGHDFAIGNNSKFSVSQNFAIGQWYHFAIVRTISDTTLRFYVDGVEKASHTSASGLDIPSKTAFSIGRDNGFTDYGMTGLIRDFRYVIGTAVYTSEFTPPRAPLTAISGTDLLLCSLPYTADASGNNNVITPTSSVFQQVSTPYPLGTGYSRDTHLGSVYFDGSGDYISVADGNYKTYGTDDFTIEMWFRATSSFPNNWLASDANSAGTTASMSVGIFLENPNVKAQVITSAGTRALNGTTTVVTNAWNHVAVTRNGTTLTLWINGISSHAITISASETINDSTEPWVIGRCGQYDGLYFNGYISDFRIVKGTAVYTSAFTPPTSKLTAISGTALLTCTNNNTIWDASGNYQTITVAGTAAASNTQRKFTSSSSLFLDGNSDYLQFAHPSNTPDAFNFGTEDFTMETWVYPQATGNNYPSFFSSVTGWSTGASGHRFDNIGKSGKYTFHLNGASPSDPFLESTNAFTHDTWVHYALTREGNTFRMFINGALEASGTYTGSYNAANGGLRLGWAGWDGANGYFAGYLQNVRITKRLARYTANFTPPTAEFEG